MSLFGIGFANHVEREFSSSLFVIHFEDHVSKLVIDGFSSFLHASNELIFGDETIVVGVIGLEFFLLFGQPFRQNREVLESWDTNVDTTDIGFSIKVEVVESE